MEIKNNVASAIKSLRLDLFPVRQKWRMWLAYLGPLALAFAWPQIVEPTILNLALVVSFILLLGRPASRYLIRGQIRADVRERIRVLKSDYAEILWMLEQLPVEERTQYTDRLKGFALRLLDLHKLLEELEK